MTQQTGGQHAADLGLDEATMKKIGAQIDACGRVLTEHGAYLEEVATRYRTEPYCSMLTNYLRAHHAADILDLADPERKEITRLMSAFFARLKRESNEMLAVYEVSDEHELAPNQREIYYTRMKALVRDLDHYP